MAKEVFKINVYDKDKNVVKTCEAVDCDLMFGSIRKLMALLQIGDDSNTDSVFFLMYKAWDELVYVLSECFPDMTAEELIPTVKGLAINMLAKAAGLPGDNSKN